MSRVTEKLLPSSEARMVSWPTPSIKEPKAAVKDAEAPHLFDLKDVPEEVRAAAQHRFGADLRMGTPRLNVPGYKHGGTYKGEVFDTQDYLIQEVAPRSVVFHRKDKLVFFSDRLKWADDHQRLNGADVQIAYDGDRPEVYPWNRARDRLTGMVASLKKSAKELGFVELAVRDGVLDQLAERTWTRIKAMRQPEHQKSRAVVCLEQPARDD